MSYPSKSAIKPNRTKQRTIFIALACLVFPAVAAISFLPNRDKYLLHTRGKYHSLGHLIAFGVVAFLAARVARTLRARVLLFLISLIFGFAIEVGEHLIFHNSLEWKDVLMDAGGVIAGTLFAILSESEEEAIAG